MELNSIKRMKLTILADNNTITDQYYLGEPAVSYWIETGDIKILFDVGYSDIFIKNARLSNIDLTEADYLVLSHGHIDHTGGLEPYIDLLGEKSNRIKLVAHEDAFQRKWFEGFGDIGTKKRRDEIGKFFDLRLTKKPLWIGNDLCFLGEIPRENNFEGKCAVGEVVKADESVPDYVLDDSALVYNADSGLIVITGCSHPGICNIVEYAKEICNEEKILDIIGGFHLLNAGEGVLNKTVEYLKGCKVRRLHPCHCTDLKARIALAGYFVIKEVGSGSVFEYK